MSTTDDTPHWHYTGVDGNQINERSSVGDIAAERDALVAREVAARIAVEKVEQEIKDTRARFAELGKMEEELEEAHEHSEMLVKLIDNIWHDSVRYRQSPLGVSRREAHEAAVALGASTPALAEGEL
jgi:hypothetical protein